MESAGTNRAKEIQLLAMMEEMMPMCPDCQTADEVVQDDAEGKVVCKGCGNVIVGELISDGSEWRTFSDGAGASKSDPHRVGGPENEMFEGMGLSTEIGEGGPAHLVKAHNRGVTKAGDRSLLAGLEKVGSMAHRLGIGQNIIEKARDVFKRVEESRELKGRKTDAVITACIFIACRQAGFPRTLSELCQGVEQEKVDVGRCFNKIKNLKLHKASNAKAGKTPSGTLQHVASITKRSSQLLKLPHKVSEVAAAVATQGYKLALAGKAEATIAAAAILLVCQLAPTTSSVPPPTLERVAGNAHLSAGTIKTAYRALWEQRMKLDLNNFCSMEAIQALPEIPT